MSSFPDSPRLLRGGLVLVDPATGNVMRIIALQYNPDTMTRTLQIRGVGADSGDHLEALRLKGPPTETIKVEAELDATDDLESNDSQTRDAGLHPQLAALETIVYPTSSHLLATHSDAQTGSIEIAPQEAPLPLFVFGPKRIVPVRITELTITEEAFDTALNPIRAKVSLGMRVLTTDDLGFEAKGGALFVAYLQAKEQLAQRRGAGSFAALGIRGIP
jgi:hypothetical protein